MTFILFRSNRVRHTLLVARWIGTLAAFCTVPYRTNCFMERTRDQPLASSLVLVHSHLRHFHLGRIAFYLLYLFPIVSVVDGINRRGNGWGSRGCRSKFSLG